eukprot:scaffold10926_cov163-Amphora_coffeaeformis.AAC.10
MMTIQKGFLLLALVVVDLTDLTLAFVVIPSSTSPSSRQDVAVHYRLAPLLQARSNDLPVAEYKKTATAMLELLSQASDLVQQIEALTTNLESCQARDPDIAEDASISSATTSRATLAATNTRSSSNSSSVTRLHQAVQRAVQAVDTHGRFSRQAEQAWRYVSHVLESDEKHPHAAYLQHPSYRYRYAQNLIAQQQQSSRPVVGQLSSHTQTVTATVQDMQQSLQSELDRLQDRELARLALARSWTG